MTERAIEVERVRGFLLSQGERYAFVELWPRVMKSRLQLIDALEGLDDAQADHKPGESEWSIRDVAAHLVDSSVRARGLVEKLASGGTANASRIEPGMRAAADSLAGIRARLLADSVAWSSLTERLPLQPPMDNVASHPFFGPLHARAWYLFQRVHDVDHFNQIEAAKKSQGYPAS